ncbi:hypothetical protein ACHAWC_008217 [Mediolabrus comicus]
MVSASSYCSRLPSNESHEFIVTYDGPIHPAAATRCSRSRTLCIRVPPSGVADELESSYVTEQHVLASLSERLGWPASMLCIDHTRCDIDDNDSVLFFPSKSFLLSEETDDDAVTTHPILLHQHPPLTAKIHPRHTCIRGGKGGFGTLLKGQSKQAGAKTTLDFGACRDLSGRRLRHVNDEIKLRKWRELQQKREKGEDVDELAALKTESGIRNWHLMVPSWSDGAAFTNKGRRKHERQLEREVRSWQSKEERAKRQKEEKKMEQEWAVMEYVRRGEVESARVSADNVKEGILEHLKKRKMEKQQSSNKNQRSVPTDVKNVTEIEQSLGLDKDDNSQTSSLITLSGEMTVFEEEKMQGQKVKQIRIQSQSDFATVGVLLDADKLREAPNTGVYIEYTIHTAGLAQIGWIRVPTTSSGDDCEMFIANSDTGDGVGDDNVSFGYDGSRKLKFNGGKEAAYGNVLGSGEKELLGWKSGDVLGSWCRRSSGDQNIEIGYLLNGKDLGIAFSIPAESKNTVSYYPALSLNLGEVVDVNLGPDFSHDVKEGCVGVSDLIKVNFRQNAEDEDWKLEAKPDAKSCDDAPPKKRSREEANTDTIKRLNAESQEEVANDTIIDAFDLDKCKSTQELEELGPDRLKSILLGMGIKCGGTTQQRAERLFALKGLRREEYPQKVRGKNFIL